MTARPFTDYLREIDRGRLLDELSEKFQSLIESVAETGKAGSISLKLSLKPTGGIDSETASLATDVKVQTPQPSRNPSLYFVTPDFNLSRRDPRQSDLEEHLHAVDGGRNAEGA